MHSENHPKPPSTAQLLLELPRASLELYRFAGKRWRKMLHQAPRGDGHPVMTLPGFGGSDASMAFLRRYLDQLGYQAQPWELGTNLIRERVTSMDEVLAFCDEMEQAIVLRVQEIMEKTGEKTSLIGWSMGGVYANSLAQSQPELVRQVITLGAPVGDPRGTSVWNILKRLSGGDIPDEEQNIEGWLQRKNQISGRKVPTSLLFSLYDGAVSRESAVIDGDNWVENIEVPSSHMGFAHNPLVYWVIADRLAQHPSSWERFDVEKLPKELRKAF